MIEHEFPPKLAERCMERAAMRHAVVKAASGDDVDAWIAAIIAVLRESGHAELVAVLKGLEPYLDAIVCYASTMGEHEPNRLVEDARAALRRAGAL